MSDFLPGIDSSLVPFEIHFTREEVAAIQKRYGGETFQEAVERLLHYHGFRVKIRKTLEGPKAVFSRAESQN